MWEEDYAPRAGSYVTSRCVPVARHSSMKDPTTLGAVISAAILLMLSVWKSRPLRWLALFIAVAALTWAFVSEAPSAVVLRWE